MWLSVSKEKLKSPLQGALLEEHAAEGVAINNHPKSNLLTPPGAMLQSLYNMITISSFKIVFFLGIQYLKPF